MKYRILLMLLSLQLTAQPKKVGGGCDGCELMYIGMPATLNATDTSAGWYEPGIKLLVTGKVLKLDGRTPAENVIVYYWQTDSKGLYSPRAGAHQSTRHGHIRGWVKTGKDGRYKIYTNRPAPYPNASEPAHIHLSIKEPTITDEYYTDELTFDDDPLLYQKKKKGYVPDNRGGSGILRVVVSGSLQITEHNIILGLHIPNYPTIEKAAISSGLEIGEDQPSFEPFHAWGPDKGSRACPVCKYGRYQGILYFVGHQPNWTEIKKWLIFLEQECNARKKYLKAYFVYSAEKKSEGSTVRKELEKIGASLKLKNVALTWVPSWQDKESDVALNKINPRIENTIVIYQHRIIIDKYINLNPSASNFKLIQEVLNKNKSDFLDLPEPSH